MNDADLRDRLQFVRRAERLKDTLRSAFTSQGRIESVADHSWRLTLLVITFGDLLPDVDLLRLLKICVLHDLGEAIHGDIPAPRQDVESPKSEQERDDFQQLIRVLPKQLQSEFLALWDEYECVSSQEARVAKALDKLETILQHNQGLNPADCDYAFNLEYGKHHTDSLSLAHSIRDILDEETLANHERRENPS